MRDESLINQQLCGDDEIHREEERKEGKMEKIMEDEWSKSKLCKLHVFMMQILHHSEIYLELRSSSSKFC